MNTETLRSTLARCSELFDLVWHAACARSKKPPKEVHEVHSAFIFRSLGRELVTFPHVHQVHDVHQLDRQMTLFGLSKIQSHCRRDGWTGRFSQTRLYCRCY